MQEIEISMVVHTQISESSYLRGTNINAVLLISGVKNETAFTSRLNKQLIIAINNYNIIIININILLLTLCSGI